MEPSKVVWRCLLSGCKTHKDLVLGRLAAVKILSVDPEDTSAHIMLSNIYAEAKMWDETAQLRKIMKVKAMKKDTGCSWSELKNKDIFLMPCSVFTVRSESKVHSILGLILSSILKIVGGLIVGIEADDEKIKLLLSQVKGKDLTELIAAGRQKLAAMPSGGPAVAGTAAAVGGPAASPYAAAAKDKEEETIEEPSDDDLGFSLFD
ncbi:hypothetical protein CRYUN_Cryun05aG0186800 [Craigia yunnanensis]